MVLTYRVIYTDEALDDIGSIYENIKSVAWFESAEKWVKRIFEKAERLSVFPDGNALYPVANMYRSTRVGKYTIIYEVNRENRVVSILDVFYGRRDIKSLLRDRRL